VTWIKKKIEICSSHLGDIGALETGLSGDDIPVDVGLAAHILDDDVEEIGLGRARLGFGRGTAVIAGVAAVVSVVAGGHDGCFWNGLGVGLGRSRGEAVWDELTMRSRCFLRGVSEAKGSDGLYLRSGSNFSQRWDCEVFAMMAEYLALEGVFCFWAAFRKVKGSAQKP